MRSSTLCFVGLFASIATVVTAVEGSWTEVSPLPFGRSDTSATTIHDRIYVAGGCDGGQDCRAGVCACSSLTVDFARYDPATDEWTGLDPIPTPRYRHQSCGWRDSVYLFGGRDLSDTIVRQVDVFNTTTMNWTTLSGPGSAYPNDLGSDNTCVTFGDAIYLMGGYLPDYSETLNVTYAFSPLTRTWTRRAGQLATGRGDFTGAALGDRLYIYGGYSAAQGFCSPLSSAEAYSPANDTWYPAPSLPDNVAEKGVGFSLNGLVYSIGGEKKAVTVGCNDADIIAVRSVFTLGHGASAWENETSLPDPRMRFSAEAAAGRVYVFGGQNAPMDGTNELSLIYTVYAYDPAPSASPGPSPAPAARSCDANAVYSPGAMGGAIIATLIGTSIVWLIVLLALRCRSGRRGADAPKAGGGATAPRAEPSDAGVDQAPLRQLGANTEPRVSTSDVRVVTTQA